jgi:glyoxylate reductase
MSNTPPHPKLPSNPKVFVTSRLPEPIEAQLGRLFDIRQNRHDYPLGPEELAQAVGACDVLVPTVTDTVDAALIDACGDNLKLIANFGAGTNHIDVAHAHAKGIIVTNTPGVLTEDTADLAMALILAAPRRLVEGDRMLRAGKFDGWTPTFMLGHRVRGMKLGIIGMGRIGQALARRAHAFGLSVHYHNRRRLHGPLEDSLGATYHDDLLSVMRDCDIVSVNCPLTPSTHHMINAEALTALGPEGYLINTSRGPVVDEAALADALADGTIAGAGLDVYEDEPAVNGRLLTLPNVILAPHIGSATHQSRTEMGEKVIINIRAVIDGHNPPDRVLPPGATMTASLRKAS